MGRVDADRPRLHMVWRQLEALGGACEERSRTGAVLGLAEVAERDHELVRVRRREDLLEVVAADVPALDGAEPSTLTSQRLRGQLSGLAAADTPKHPALAKATKEESGGGER